MKTWVEQFNFEFITDCLWYCMMMNATSPNKDLSWHKDLFKELHFYISTKRKRFCYTKSELAPFFLMSPKCSRGGEKNLREKERREQRRNWEEMYSFCGFSLLPSWQEMNRTLRGQSHSVFLAMNPHIFHSNGSNMRKDAWWLATWSFLCPFRLVKPLTNWINSNNFRS